MDNLVQILDRIARTTAGLMAQFAGQPNMTAIQASYGVQIQELEDMFWDLYLLQTLANATGAQLDELGVIVDEPRSGKNDANYRAAIYGRITLNKSHARIEDILFTMTTILDNSYILRELDDQTFIITLEDAKPSTIDAETFNDALQRNRGGGVHAHFHYSDYDNTDTFTWADGDVEQTDADQGWGNDAETAGGYWSDVVE